MAITLWIVMLVLAAASWYLSRPGGRRAARIGIAVVDAAFTVWVILTHLSTVGYWWVIVTIALSLLVTFRSDVEGVWARRDSGSSPNQ